MWFCRGCKMKHRYHRPCRDQFTGKAKGLSIIKVSALKGGLHRGSFRCYEQGSTDYISEDLLLL